MALRPNRPSKALGPYSIGSAMMCGLAEQRSPFTEEPRTLVGYVAQRTRAEPTHRLGSCPSSHERMFRRRGSKSSPLLKRESSNSCDRGSRQTLLRVNLEEVEI